MVLLRTKMISGADEHRKKKKLAEAQQNYLDALEASRVSSSSSTGQSSTAASSASPCQNEPFVPWMPQAAVSPVRPSRRAAAAQHMREEEIFNIDDLNNAPPEPAHAPLPAVPPAPILHAPAVPPAPLLPAPMTPPALIDHAPVVPPAPIAHAPVVPPAPIVHAQDGPAPDGPAPAAFNVPPCVACLEARPTELCIPCHHLCLCEACSLHLMQEGDVRCPVCRSHLECFTKAFY